MTNQPDPEEKRLRRIERTIDLLKSHMQQENLILQQLAEEIARIRGVAIVDDPTCRQIKKYREQIESMKNISGM